MEFLRSFLRRHFVGNPVASRNVGCFLRLHREGIYTSFKHQLLASIEVVQRTEELTLVLTDFKGLASNPLEENFS